MKTPIFSCIIILAFVINTVHGQTTAPQVQEGTSIEESSSKAINSVFQKFTANSKIIEKLADADKNFWIKVNGNENLLLKYITHNKNKRGNILILHSQGENAIHSRLVQPLTKQLLSLGWNVFIPNIMQESFLTNFAKKNSKVNDITTQDNSTNANTLDTPDNSENKESSPILDDINTGSSGKVFFKSFQEYQSYFNNLCKGVFEQTKILNLPLLIIANQHSAYWSIQCLKLTPQVIPIVFLQPEIPQGSEIDLKTIFSEQRAPFFSFIPTASQNDFNEMLKKGFWLSQSQRFNQGTLSNLRLEEQNLQLAKTITGWIEKQRK